MAKEDLLKKLADEKFNGGLPKFRDARFDQVNIKCAEDSKNWYMFYDSAPVIIVQEKASNNPPYCYTCKGPINFITRHNSVHFEEFEGPVGGGEVRTMRIPYCPNCNEKPTDHGVITESIQESLGR